jgi:hypothetical protein
LAGLVCKTLSEAGIDAVLVGGSCVSIYSNEQFVSLDLDFIALGSVSNRKIGAALAEIGFEQKTGSSRYFVHPDTSLYLEFPPSPVMVGDEYVPEDKHEELETAGGTVRLLRPTDCVKDRLANFYYSKDHQCYEQAKLVASMQPVDWSDLERWHKNEGQASGFAKFKSDTQL